MGKYIFLDDEACTILKANGYNVNLNWTATAPSSIFKRGMATFNVTDANGDGIGDTQMQNLLGDPIPR